MGMAELNPTVSSRGAATTSVCHSAEVHSVAFVDSPLATASYNQESLTVRCNYLYLYGPPTPSILLALAAAARLNGGVFIHEIKV